MDLFRGYNNNEDDGGSFTGWLLALHGLLNRTLIVWLAALGLAVIPGWLP